MTDQCTAYVGWRDVPESDCKIAECRYYAWDSYSCELAGETCPWKGYPDKDPQK